MQLIPFVEAISMKNKLSPFAASIAAGLEEAITHAKGAQVPGILQNILTKSGKRKKPTPEQTVAHQSR